ncbi:MAG: bifunctional DNA primase/polymerase, partial [Bacteroidetes bacterium]|nr:bifunctional DNA primase/polymerase [Bacteroidota bacterium]
MQKTALWYQQKFGFNVLPLSGKKPLISWEEWQNKEQLTEDIKKMSWNSDTTGVGGMSGNKNIRVLDFDKIKKPDMIITFIEDLGLPEKYPWIVKSGSGEGCHIWVTIKAEAKLFEYLEGEKSNYKFSLIDDFADHLELRWKNCQTALPPSVHPNKNKYEFVNGKPDEKPIELNVDKLIKVLKKYTKEPEKKIKDDITLKTTTDFIDKKKIWSAIKFLGPNLQKHCYDDWFRLGFALASIGEEGREYFVKLSMLNPHYHDKENDINRKFDSLLKDYRGDITLGSLFAIAEQYGWRKPMTKFWIVKDDKVSISRRKFIQFLEENGFYKMELDSGYDFIRVDKNVVRRIEVHNIKDYVRSYIRKLTIEELEGVSRGDVLDAVLKSSNINFGQGALEWLVQNEIEFAEDTRDSSYIFYNNGFVEVTRDRIELKDYKNLEGKIWEKQMIDRSFNSIDEECEFELFLLNICRKDVNRYKA